jgi:predicted lipoprotein with Yx(FWY)xxD motif
MKKLLILGAALAASAALAACGGSGGGSAAPASSSGGSTATVSSEDIGSAGRVLVDSSGQALYASDQEANGNVLCTGACLSFWKPLTVGGATPTGASVPGSLGTEQRPDGTKQVTYDGKLLYTFTEDQPGEVTGDGFSDAFAAQQFTWHVVHADTRQDSTGSTGSSGGLYG